MTDVETGVAGAGRSGSALSGAWAALAVAAVLGVFSGVADWVWYRFLEDGALAPAIGHGLLFFVVLALALGAVAPPPRRRATLRLLATLPLVGVVLAAVFYPVASVVGYLGGLLVTWAAMWMALALAIDRAGVRALGLRQALGRGLLAAVLSGLAFWTVSWMWTRPSPGGPPVLLHVACWTWALAPGFLALLFAGRLRRS